MSKSPRAIDCGHIDCNGVRIRELLEASPCLSDDERLSFMPDSQFGSMLNRKRIGEARNEPALLAELLRSTDHIDDDPRQRLADLERRLEAEDCFQPRHAL